LVLSTITSLAVPGSQSSSADISILSKLEKLFASS
jgi:hypothetical protein